MAEIKTDCVHYIRGDCKILKPEYGRINCALKKCSFYETREQYKARQKGFNERYARELSRIGLSHAIREIKD